MRVRTRLSEGTVWLEPGELVREEGWDRGGVGQVQRVGEVGRGQTTQALLAVPAEAGA